MNNKYKSIITMYDNCYTIEIVIKNIEYLLFIQHDSNNFFITIYKNYTLDSFINNSIQDNLKHYFGNFKSLLSFITHIESL